MRPVGAHWGHFAAKRPEISTNGSTRSESSRQPACPRLSLPPPALGERRHRGLARRRVAVRGACDFSWMSRLAKDQRQQPRALANADHGKAACAIR